jgi:abhydrolase domain-containing protein 6
MKKPLLAIGFALALVAAARTSRARRAIFDLLMAMERSAAGLKARTVNIGHYALSYLERPGPGETVVLVHGFSANKDNWARFVRFIPKAYRVIAIDMPGHGDSAKPGDKTYSVEFLTDAFARAVDALKLGRFHLAGNSMGGHIALLYASRNPGRVIDLCVLSPEGVYQGITQLSDLMVAMSQGKSPLTPTTTKDIDEFLDYGFHKRPFMPWPVKSVLADMAVESAPFVKKMFTDYNSNLQDVVPLLPGLATPVLVVWGDRDRIFHVSTSEVLARHLQNREVAIIKECGHVPMMERPGETARHYAGFMARNGGAG